MWRNRRRATSIFSSVYVRKFVVKIVQIGSMTILHSTPPLSSFPKIVAAMMTP